MKRAFVVIICVIAFAGFAVAADEPHPAAPTNPMWEKMKTLEGAWTTKTEYGTSLTTYRLTSGGSAMIQTIDAPGEGEMTTVFHPVGQTVVGTHYCLSMNQPTFVASPGPDASVISFKFKSVDNLKTPTSGHMRELVLKIADKDHHSQTWSYRANGKDSTDTFVAERKK